MRSLYDAATYHQGTLALDLGRTKETVRHYAIYERQFLVWLADQHLPPTLAALNRDNVRACARWLAEQPHAGRRNGATVPREFASVMHTWAGFLFKEGLLAFDPLHGSGLPKVDELEAPPFSRPDILALRAVAGADTLPNGRQKPPFDRTRDLCLLLLLLDTGIRIDEACRLDVPQVTLLLRTITVSGKGRRQRTVPFGDPLAPDGGPTVRAIRTYLAERERLFERIPGRRSEAFLLSYRGYRLTPPGARTLFKRLGTQAGVADCHPHRCRHSFASAWLTQYPGDEAGLRRVLGHVSERVMRRYVHFAELVIAERHGRGSPVTQWLGRASPSTNERPRTLARLDNESSAEDAVPPERRTQRTTRRPRVNPVSATPLPDVSVADVAAREDVVRKPADHPAQPTTDLAGQIRAMQQHLADLLNQMESQDA